MKKSNSSDGAKLFPVTRNEPPTFGLSGIILKDEFFKIPALDPLEV